MALSVPYIVNYTDGRNFIIAPGVTNDTESSIKLFGHGVVIYGENLNENLLHMLENFSNDAPPSPAVDGQLWFDRIDGMLRVFHNTTWWPCGVAFSSTEPTSPETGFIWKDPTATRLKFWTGSAWELMAFSSEITNLSAALSTETANRIAGDATLTNNKVDRAGDTITFLNVKDLSVGTSFTKLVPTASSSNVNFYTNNSPLIDSAIVCTGGSGVTQYEGTMTLHGYTLLDRDPTQNMQAATRQFVITQATTIANNAVSSNNTSMDTRPFYAQYINASGAGPFTVPGAGGNNVHLARGSLQVFLNGVYQIENLNYTFTSGSPNASITLVSPPPAFDLIIYSFTGNV